MHDDEGQEMATRYIIQGVIALNDFFMLVPH